MKARILSFFFFSVLLVMNSCTKDEEVVMPVATATPMTQAITSGASTSIALSSSVTGTTFSWTVIQTGVAGATAGSGTSIAQMLTTTGATAGTATYKVIPTAAGTTGNPVSVVITVNPLKVTYMSNIKPLLTTSCTPCHLQGGANPNKFDDYTTSKTKIAGIIDRVQRETTAAGFMPKGGSKLSAENIALLKKWVDDGLLEK